MAVLAMRDALNQALREEMKRDESVFLLGEDIGLYDGSFKVTRGLMKEFGEKRVLDTPIAEEIIIGTAIGAAMSGLRPVAEMMTVNFIMVAMDQVVNAAAHIRYMFGGGAKVPLVIRTPGGGGHQLGAQHSHSHENWFAHVPGLKVVAPGTPADAKGMLKSAIRDDNPVMFIENEGTYAVKGDVPDGEHLVPLDKNEVKRPGEHITICAHSRMLIVAMVQMPRLSDSMETGKILRWLKKEGDQVQKGEPLVEIESDKANIEVEAYATGKLSKIVVPEGESAPIGAVIAEIGDGSTAPPADKAPADKAPAPHGQAEAAEPKQGARPADAEEPKAQATPPEAHVAQADKAVAATAQSAADAGGEQYPHGGPDDRTEVGAAAQAALNVIRRPAEQENGERQRVSPVARRLAEEHGVDLRRVQGTGPGGRITKEDVEAAAQRRATPTPALPRERGRETERPPVAPPTRE